MKRRRGPMVKRRASDEPEFLESLFENLEAYRHVAASIVKSEHRPRHTRSKPQPVVVVRKRRVESA